ncbi:MAG: peptidase domain-containing ABC transporter [Planctomycetaceae bacterium]
MTQPETNEPAPQTTTTAVDGFGEMGAEAIRLLCGERRRVDVSAIRRALADAMLAWPGTADERWWKWLVETGRGLSYAARVIDASPQEVFELLRHGVEAVTIGDGDELKLLVLTGAKRQKIRLCQLPGKPAGRWVSLRELSASLGGTKRTAERRWWVILDPMSDDMPLAAGSHGGKTGHGEHATPTPWSRLWEFMRPERSDLWIVLVFALFTGMLTLATPIAVEALVNTVAFGTLLQPLIVLSIILLTFLGFAAALRFLQRFVVELIQRRLFARVVGRLAWQLPRVRLDAAHQLTPELLNRFFDVVTMQKVVAQLTLDGLTVVLTVSLGMIVLAFYHPWLLAFDAVLLVMLAFNVFVLSRGAMRTSIAESASKYAAAGWLEDIARCPTTFKGFGAAEFALTRADRLTTDYLVAREAHYHVIIRHIILGLALEAIASTVLLGLGGFLVIQGQMTLGQLVAAELIVTLIVAAIAKLEKQFEGFYDLLTSMDKLGHLFDLPIEPSWGLIHVGHSGAARLSLRGVGFSHDDGSVGLSEVSFEVAPGEVVAITGPAGCGKSTLLDLLFRLREPSSGRIVLDDFDLGDLRPDALRQIVSLVRGIEVLDGTLAENVHLDRPEITTTDVRDALRRMELAEDALSSHVRLNVGVPSGESSNGTNATRSGERGYQNWSLDTHLAHDGKPLSESQARRLMLARAVVGKPRLLLIDGLLDALPDEDGERLLEELKRTRGNCSVVLATGRKSLAAKCDRVCEL